MSTHSPSRRLPIVGAAAIVLLALLVVTPRAARSEVNAVGATPAISTAAPFFLAEVGAKVHGRWGAAWQTLYPFHQRVAPLGTYVKCENQTPFPAPLRAISVESVVRARVHVSGLAHRIAGVALTVRFALQSYGPRDPIVSRHIFHLVPVNGRWTWLLSASEYELYVHGGCNA